MLFSNKKIHSLSCIIVCKFLLTQFHPHNQVEPGKLTQYRRLISKSLRDTFIIFSKTHVSKWTPLFKNNSVNSTFVILNYLKNSFVLSFSALLGQVFFQFSQEVFFFKFVNTLLIYISAIGTFK